MNLRTDAIPDSSKPVPPRHLQPLVSDVFAIWIIGFCAVTPFPLDLIGWATIFAGMLYYLVARRATLGEVQATIPTIAILFWTVLSTLWSVNVTSTITNVVQFTLWTSFGLLLPVRRTPRQLIHVVAVGLFAVVLVSWMAALIIPEIAYSSDPTDTGAFKGLLIQKNAMGFFGTLTTAALGCRASTATTRREKTWVMGALALSVFTVVQTTSGTAISLTVVISAVAILLGVLARARRPIGLAFTACTVFVLSAAWLLVSKPDLVTEALGKDPTLTGRTRIWEVVAQAIADRPILGYGWNALWHEGTPVTEMLWAENGYPFFHAHNGYLDLTAQIGIVGAAIAFGVIAILIVKGVCTFLAEPSQVTAWPILLGLLIVLYNFTEVVGFRGSPWIIIVAASVVQIGRRGTISASRLRA